MCYSQEFAPLTDGLFFAQNPVQSGVGGMSLSGVGMKRPADAMRSVFTM